MKKILILLIAFPVFAACSLDDNVQIVETKLTFKFTHQWENNTFSYNDLITTPFANENGDELKIERLRYLVSNIRLYRESGNSVELKGYHLIDLFDENSLSFTTTENIPSGDYNLISFTFGLTPQFNISGSYSDLNSVSWNWPDNLGGGYHFLQMDGTYATTEGPQPFNYHMGTARLGEGIFEANHVNLFFTRDYSIQGNTTFEFKMDIAEWFKNPHIWDLNEFNTDLMMNYTAQKMMSANCASVFSLGSVTTP